ncbi:MAG: hypothetical protein QXE45_05410, partial [Thermoplasmata archaeon]
FQRERMSAWAGDIFRNQLTGQLSDFQETMIASLDISRREPTESDGDYGKSPVIIIFKRLELNYFFFRT